MNAANTIAAATDQFAETVSASVNLNDFISLVGPAYYYYDGSLTTPDCNEAANFIVFEKTISISESQVINNIDVI